MLWRNAPVNQVSEHEIRSNEASCPEHERKKNERVSWKTAYVRRKEVMGMCGSKTHWYRGPDHWGGGVGRERKGWGGLWEKLL